MPTWEENIGPKKIQIAMVTCDHGLGHIRRACRIAQFIKRKNLNISIASHPKKVRQVLKNLKEKKRIFTKYYKFTPFADKNKKSYHFLISKKLKNHLKRCQFILCDNFIEILKEFPQSHLLANFFWHKKNYSLKIKFQKIKKHLKKKLIFGDKYFAASYIKNQKTFIPLPLITRPTDKFKWKPDIMLMPSSEMYEKREFLKLKRFLQKTSKRNIYVHPKIYETNDPENIVKINSFDRFPKSVGICVCRPGLGIISDCCENGIMPVCFYQKEDSEMKCNHKILLENGFTFLKDRNLKAVTKYLALNQKNDQMRSFNAQKTKLAKRENSKNEIRKKLFGI